MRIFFTFKTSQQNDKYFFQLLKISTMTNNLFDLHKVNKITSKFLTCLKSVSNHLRSNHLCIVKTQVKVIESKMTYSESESDSNFASNSLSDSNFDSEFDSNSLFMNLVIFIFFDLYLHSSK